ncbi:F-box protein At2g02240-like [Olea europaea var. sylvestris]|uniref:F-box protein At2g02240-like n=1 Tax=Olea europaea var. sylvestris TaxID=158386 RepID=UPI000C1D51D4|nr:F-box protein At2g02240-like [Olea europaea var. sylvestris]
MDSFARLPEECISTILSLTSPMDTTKFSIISHGFKSASDSDNVWERFLPPDYRQIISTSVSPVLYATKKHLYFNLCHSPILLHEGNTSFSLDIRNGKKCYVLGARKLLLSWGGCWSWTQHPQSRFSEVAKLKCPGSIHIRGKIKTQMLSSNTAYAAYLVFHLAERLNGLESSRTVIRFVDPQIGNSMIVTVEGTEKPESEGTGKIAQMRRDGWMEIEMGNFYNGEDDNREVEAWLIEINNPVGKSGFIVEGIEFRPV